MLPSVTVGWDHYDWDYIALMSQLLIAGQLCALYEDQCRNPSGLSVKNPVKNLEQAQYAYKVLSARLRAMELYFVGHQRTPPDYYAYKAWQVIRSN